MSPLSREFSILQMYRSASPEQVLAGESWYETARHEAKHLSKRYGVDYRRAAGVIAALSPRSKWVKNKQDADTILRYASQGSEIIPRVTAYFTATYLETTTE